MLKWLLQTIANRLDGIELFPNILSNTVHQKHFNITKIRVHTDRASVTNQRVQYVSHPSDAGMTHQWGCHFHALTYFTMTIFFILNAWIGLLCHQIEIMLRHDDIAIRFKA